MSECHLEFTTKQREADDLTRDDTFREEKGTNNQILRNVCLLLRNWWRKSAEKLLEEWWRCRGNSLLSGKS